MYTAPPQLFASGLPSISLLTGAKSFALCDFLALSANPNHARPLNGAPSATCKLLRSSLHSWRGQKSAHPLSFHTLRHSWKNNRGWHWFDQPTNSSADSFLHSSGDKSSHCYSYEKTLEVGVQRTFPLWRSIPAPGADWFSSASVRPCLPASLTSRLSLATCRRYTGEFQIIGDSCP